MACVCGPEQALYRAALYGGEVLVFRNLKAIPAPKPNKLKPNPMLLKPKLKGDPNVSPMVRVGDIAAHMPDMHAACKW